MAAAGSPPLERGVVGIESLRCTGTAALRASDGAVLKTSGDLASKEGQGLLPSFYAMLQASGSILKDEPMRKLTVNFETHSYAVAVSGGVIYIAKSPNE
uniref:Late endosomal/lysosomal adaptor and MAPK and MTOR activator 5 n=1 Tax=Rhizochromulina marina TaxID=1034831 RepID=A0A7S2S4A7_9STRA